ncbi:hypothetical protein WA556_001584 [Blastocystis sp. ATCC 50177/Nand II]
MGNTCSSSNYDGENSTSMLFEGRETPPPRSPSPLSKENDNQEKSIDGKKGTGVIPYRDYSSNSQYWSTESGNSVMERFQTLTMRRGFKPELLIDIPPGVDENTWIFEKAQFYLEECRLLFESINDSCTPSSCPEMTAGPHYTYLWTDAMHPTPISIPACSYIRNSFIWMERTFSGSSFCNTENGVFPEDFMDVMMVAFKRLFRVYAHVYHHHLNEFVKNSADVYLNTSFKYFGLFARQYGLLSKKEEAPLHKLLEQLIHNKAPSSDDYSLH